MPEKNFRVAIIGAGVSGLCSIKSCLEEGLEPVCFERTAHIGGLWHYEDDPTDGQGCVMKSTVINTSKEMMAYSDFLVPDECPNFMHNTQVDKYLQLYSERFGLEKHVRFNTEVVYVTQAADFAQLGQWCITTRTNGSKEDVTEVFDAVMLCTGHHADKFVPTFPGLQNFKGTVMHSHDYRKPTGFENKRILIVGIGNSGGDAAVELSRVASQVYLSTRQGTWLFQRVGHRGIPLDLEITRRFSLWLSTKIPFSITNAALKRNIEARVDHEMFRLRPNYEPLQQHPMVNDDLPNRILCGSIQIKTDVKKFTEFGVEFVDGSKAENIDVVILATGYSFGFPYVDKKVIDVKENVVDLYLNTFLPDLQKPTMAVIGCFQAFGAIMPGSELQARVATRVFKGDVTLPTPEKMWTAVEAHRDYNSKRFAQSRRHTIQVDLLGFMDSLAELCGCGINFRHLIFTDPMLALNVMFGPLTPYQYRLYGHGKWSGARKAIMTQWDRVRTPLKTRPLAHVPAKWKTISWKTVSDSYAFMLALMIVAVILLNWLLMG